MKTEKEVKKKTGGDDAGAVVTRKSEGRRKRTYDEEHTIALEEIHEEKLDYKAGQARG